MKRWICAGVVLAIALLAVGYYAIGLGANNDPSAYGKFVGSVVTEWDANGRDMRLVQDFAYVDPRERIWLAPANSMINGASIPKPFWSLIGGPFEGKYRNASVVHDVACVEKKQPSTEVHRAFYEACRCGGVDERMSRILYGAVAKFGPAWTFETVEREKVQTVVKYIPEERTRTVTDPTTGVERTETYIVQVPVSEAMTQTVREQVPVIIARTEPTEEDVQDLIRTIEQNNPSLDDLGAMGSIPESGAAPGGD